VRRERLQLAVKRVVGAVVRAERVAGEHDACAAEGRLHNFQPRRTQHHRLLAALAQVVPQRRTQPCTAGKSTQRHALLMLAPGAFPPKCRCVHVCLSLR